MTGRLLAQVQFVDQFFITIGFCFAQIIKETPALRDHLKQAAARRMIFPIGLKVLGQMLDTAGQKCDLHIRAAGILVMQLKLLETQRFAALCHNEGATLDEEAVLATARRSQACGIRPLVPPLGFRVCRRTTGAVSSANAPREDPRRPLRRTREEIV